MLRPSNINWFSNFTFDNRYHLTGITDLVIEYAKQAGKNELTILDVGCSIAVALQETQKELEASGIKSHTIGIDVDKKVREKATSNVDEFLNHDILEVRGKESVADIVICSKMALYVFVDRRVKIISKSASLLKTDGILITDADCYELPKAFDDLRDLYRYYWPPFGVLKHNGVRTFLKEYEKKRNLRFRKMTRVLQGRQEAEGYAARILAGWNKLRWDQKREREIDVLIKMFMQKIIPNKPKQRKRKS